VPVAGQDDPRYDAALRADPMLQRRLRADREGVWPEVETGAAKWTLLLQVSQADLMQARCVEGTVYYVVRKSDLLARDFLAGRGHLPTDLNEAAGGVLYSGSNNGHRARDCPRSSPPAASPPMPSDLALFHVKRRSPRKQVAREAGCE
jgi:hypothetical protein